MIKSLDFLSHGILIAFQMTSIKSIVQEINLHMEDPYRILFVTLCVVTKSANLSWYEIMHWNLSPVIESNGKS